MAIEHKSQAVSLKENIDKLKVLYKNLEDENKKLTEKLNERELDLMHAHKRILDLESEKNCLKIANGLAKTEEDKLFYKKQISELVREINSCIALLTQQQ
jgi:peptidoglycan hydrolase CwlO-like protein